MTISFVAHVGAKDKYNARFTIATVKIVYHFMQKTTVTTFKGFIDEFSQLNYNFKELLATHYSFDIFNSDDAKARFMKPDLLTFT